MLPLEQIVGVPSGESGLLGPRDVTGTPPVLARIAEALEHVADGIGDRGDLDECDSVLINLDHIANQIRHIATRNTP
jgi:hypothetical protein